MQAMRSTGQSRRHQNKFLRIVTTPYRALCRAGDMYVRSVTRCGQPPSFVPSKSKSKSNLPRSFSAASSSSISTLDHNNEDYRELVRAASVRTLRESSETEAESMMNQPRSVRRSVSVGIGMGRIDEETPFEVGEVIRGGDEARQSGFGESSMKMMKKKGGDLLYPRSKSYAVGVGDNRTVAY